MSVAWPESPPIEGWWIKIRKLARPGASRAIPPTVAGPPCWPPGDAQGHHIILDVLHGVIDGHAGSDGATRGVDVKLHIPLRILLLQVKHLRDDQVGNVVVDGHADKDNVVVQQPGVNIVRMLTPNRSAR